ncbi:metallo-beta-lactamase domain protein [Clostridiales bacterium oral taxon 876 str. F0540]|nr:metallo-beta-lactamase domain protein [Clostridiales bacterium oral taxon 876 str. F0540]
MSITEGIKMLEIPVNINGSQSIIYPVVLVDKDSLVLVDTGYPNQLTQLKQAFKAENLPFNLLKSIIITHQDIDHVGSLMSIKKEVSDSIDIFAHEAEAPYIEGSKRPVKLAFLESKLESLTEEMKLIYQGFKNFYDNLHVNINSILTDNQTLPYCGGITVIFTPGHTPGHICLYHKETKTLIAGDCLGIENGELVTSPASINYNQDLYMESLEKLSESEIAAVICYHGGLYEGNVSQRIKELIRK